MGEGVTAVISHFQYKPVHSSKLFGWTISFFYKGKRIEATYHKDGRVEWHQNQPSAEELDTITRAIHELMLYHVYDGS